MKLIKVEAHGFKSFADRTVLNFDGGVVGIVGPNGSGKSNINDAIKWVLGEQSIKSLRGDKADDIIFSGSKKMEPMNKAEVSLTFDNSEGRVSIPHKKFTITRSIQRGVGGNSYFINGEPARLKQIKEVAMESGIGKSSLAIISQGTISDIAEASPEDRRGIFEEAAGISRYKQRKKEALSKLNKTNETLDKVRTVINELDKQRNPLKRQAEKAEIYLSKKNKLEKVEMGLIAEDLQFFGKKLKELNEELEEVYSTKENYEERLAEIEPNFREKSVYKTNVESELHQLTQDLDEIKEQLRQNEILSSQASQRRKMLIEGQIQATSQARMDVIKEELKELSAKISNYKIWESKSSEDVSSKTGSIAEIDKKISEFSFSIEKGKRDLMKLRTQLSVLTEFRDKKTNLFKGTRKIVENKHLFPGYNGIVADLIKVDNQYVTAIETILANALQHVVVNDSQDAIKAVNFLRNNHAGRATFIPLSSIKPKGINDNHHMVIKNQPGFVGMAHELINVSPKYNILARFLLGNVIVASTIEDANNISRTMKNMYMVVTLAGDVIRAGGVISGGEKQGSKDMLGVEDKIQKIELMIPTIKKSIDEKIQDQMALQNAIAEDRSLVAELSMEKVRVKEKRMILEQQFNSLKLQYEEESKEELELKDDVASHHDVLESEKISLTAQINSKKETIIALNREITNLTIEKSEIEKLLRQIIEQSSAKFTAKSQAEYQIKTATERLSTEYGMMPENVMEKYSLKTSRDEAREIVNQIRREIKELGYVNVDAIQTFKEVDERWQRLKKSEEELMNAQDTINAAIDEMDQIIVKRLDATVKGVNQEMDVIFKTMFGGGTAAVKYTNPSNLLETGIDVIAQPPGKTVKNLKLFSGGEKALVAISLLFAILKSKPLPLCILDEVEAALDDANVVRYATYLQELKKQTQFIVVTHRVGTMARVDHLFGATMQTRGVTSFFTVKLSDAKKLIEN